ncbi:MAG TPA: methyltransferase domain-containing protein [Thermoanaerobaculia bacterium]|nr:methyltransferase domain-containing protein [Thermoanaerobaculia bacterium]
MTIDEKEQLRRSWVANAASWRDAVREGRIASRRVATDAAIVDVVAGLRPGKVLDLGCGEGWLARALAAEGIEVCGVDASRPLIEAATELGGGSFHALSYEELSSGDVTLPAPFDLAVANFSMLEEDVRAILIAAARMVRPDGALVIQTVHPAFVTGEYASGWRTETFASFAGEWPEPMPWYFRTLAGWVEVLSQHGYGITDVQEPLDPQNHRPLSIIFVCRRIAR